MANNVYTAHRENQIEGILQAAQDLFIRKGIEQVTMKDIAKASGLTRATIYNYFSNKEEIAQALFKQVTLGWRERNEREVWDFPGTGFERLENFLVTFFSYLFLNPQEAGFVAELNYLYAKHWSAEVFVETMLGNLTQDRQYVLESIQLGITDGSLRADMGSELMLAAFFNFISGMISRFGEMGDKVEAEFGISSQKIFTQIYRVFLDGLKPQPNQK